MSGSASGIDEVNALVADLKTRMPKDLRACKERNAIEKEEGRFDGKMVLLWFWAEVSAWECRRSLPMLQKKKTD